MFKVSMRIFLIASLLLTLALSSGIVSSQEEPVTLTFVGWGGPEEVEVFQHLVEVFNENNPDIVIEYQNIPNAEYITSLTTLIAGGTPPDIAYIPDGDFSAFVTRDQLVSLQPFVDASDVIDEENIWPSALGRYRFSGEAFGEGDLYALPKDIVPTVLFINVDLFEEAGVPLPDPNVPLTWDEILEIGAQITRDAEGRHPGEEGFDVNTVEVWGVGDMWFENTVYGNGGRMVSEDGRTFVAPEDQNTIDALQWLSDLTHLYQVHPTSQQTASMSLGQMFDSGQVAMTTNGRWATTFYRDALEFEWDVRPNPVGPSGEVTSFNNQEDCTFSGWSGSVGLAIIAGSKGEEYAEEAYRFIEFIAGPEGQTEQAALGFAIPNQIDIANSDAFLQPDQMPANAQVFLEAARCELPGPWVQTPLYTQWFDPHWWNSLWPAVMNEGSELAEDALASRAGDFQTSLDEAWATISD